MARSRECLKVDFLPDVDLVVDVGVASGTPWLYERWPEADLHLIDPIPGGAELSRLLGDRPYEFHEVALGESQGTVKFNANLDQASLSSVLERTPLTKTDHRYESVEVPMITLDSLLPGLLGDSEAKKMGLKIDTEGYELNVLRGALQFLRFCEFVVCEVSVRKRFFDSYTFEELIRFMSESAFRVDSVLSAPTDPQGVCRFLNMAFTRSRED
jgi:FkbM family methyltransferase